MNCKLGDLAIVVRSPSGVNLGKLVRVTGWIASIGDWRVESVGGLLHSQAGLLPFGYCPDAWLRPIRPDEEPERITSDLEVTA